MTRTHTGSICQSRIELAESTPTRTTLRFRGGFHNSAEIGVRVTVESVEYGRLVYSLSARQQKRLHAHFCGIRGCCCGGFSRAERVSP
jgi:hypothetical protein